MRISAYAKQNDDEHEAECERHRSVNYNVHSVKLLNYIREFLSLYTENAWLYIIMSVIMHERRRTLPVCFSDSEDNNSSLHVIQCDKDCPNQATGFQNEYYPSIEKLFTKTMALVVFYKIIDMHSGESKGDNYERYH